MNISRRAFCASAMAGLAMPAFAQGILARSGAKGRLAFPETRKPHPDFRTLLPNPVKIRSVELWVTPEAKTTLVRVMSEDGVEGVVRASTKVEHTGEFFKAFAVPRFTGTDARDVADTIRRAAREDYEYAGLPYWATQGQVELAIWDMLGKTARKSCAEMIGPILHRSIPIYMSSNKRDTAPEAEIAHLQQRVAETGAKCVKVKIGRRMGYNSDMVPGRTEAIISGVRKAFGDAMTIYADANGAYDARKGLEIAAMLEDHGVALFEEPCPFEDFEMTAQLTRAIRKKGYRLKVAGGENDYALERWRWLTSNRAFDVIQPDPMYAGGIFRNLEIMKMGREAKLLYNPHFPRNGADTAPMLHLCAISPNLWGFQEYRSREDKLDFAHSPMLQPMGGEVPVPLGPGWGIDYDPLIWGNSVRA
jgi:L-alanine-DL-glutamate epimerase-like enolase superfamily enzyme